MPLCPSWALGSLTQIPASYWVSSCWSAHRSEALGIKSALCALFRVDIHVSELIIQLMERFMSWVFVLVTSFNLIFIHGEEQVIPSRFESVNVPKIS